MSMLEPLPPIPHLDGQETLDLDEVVEVLIPYLPTETKAATWDLPPFSGKKVACAKCGIGAFSDDSPVAVNFHAGVAVSTSNPCYQMMRWNTPLYLQIGFPEHLDRRCPLCNYTWVEALADGPAEPEGD